MISAVALSHVPSTAAICGPNLVRSKSASIQAISNLKPSKFAVSFLKPLYLAPLDGPCAPVPKPQRQQFKFQCAASAADEESKSEVVPARSAAAQRLKISIYFATWWALNVIFNIYNKKVLNAFPYPWLTSTLSLACGSAMMLISWATRLVEAPKTDLDFWKVLFPVAVAHTVGHVAATVSMSKVAVSFTHIIKSAEPAFSVLVSRFLLGETFPVPVYLSLVPIIGGCALAAVTELNFNMIGFMGAMISNLAFVFRNIFSKRGMKGKSVSGMNYYACLSIMSLVILTPFAIAMEGPQMWAAGWQKALSDIGPNIIWWVAAQSVFYHLYNQVSYMSLDEISPLTFSIGNTMKRITVIVSSIIIFHTPVRPVNALGAAIAILGTFLYSQGRAPRVQYFVNGHEYNMGYYLADGIYPEWAAFVKTVPLPQTDKHRLFAQHQEGVRKDVERAFGVLQSHFAILHGPARFWQRAALLKIMRACVILHNMIVEDERDLNGLLYDFDNSQGTSTVTLPTIYHGGTVAFADVLQRNADLRAQPMHATLKTDLIGHIWERFGGVHGD